MSLDWAYLRAGCTTCMRARTFLAARNIAIEETVDARKDRIPGSRALDRLADIDHLYATRGRRVVHLDLRSKPPREAIVALLIGPSGNLRAPAARTGRTLLVGFDETMYERLVR